MKVSLRILGIMFVSLSAIFTVGCIDTGPDGNDQSSTSTTDTITPPPPTPEERLTGAWILNSVKYHHVKITILTDRATKSTGEHLS